jgi:hypothetical protein
MARDGDVNPIETDKSNSSGPDINPAIAFAATLSSCFEIGIT